MITRIHYLLGPNGTGKTRALEKLCESQKGFFIPATKSQGTWQSSDADVRSVTGRYADYQKRNPERIALSLLRNDAKLRYTIFQIISKKIGRNISIEVSERSDNFSVTSELNDIFFAEVTAPRYSLNSESAGLKGLLVILTLIHSGISKKYFIDEPEVSLHPEAQRFIKNEMIRLCTDKEVEFWIATHSPVFFAPSSIEELQQAIFFSDPQKEGSPPDFTQFTPQEKAYLDKSLLRLDSEKWLLAHSKGVIFCEGFIDKIIIRKVLEKADVDISRQDFSLIETGGKEDFSVLKMLSDSINKRALFIGDLDCLLECRLLEKYESSETMRDELKGLAISMIEYIRNNIRTPLSRIHRAVSEIPENMLKERDTDNVISSYIATIRDLGNANSKSIALGVIIRSPDKIKNIINDNSINLTIDLLCESTYRAIEMLKKVGFFIIKSGSIETLYKDNSSVSISDKKKNLMLDLELSAINTESRENTIERYKDIINFVQKMTLEVHDVRSYFYSELTKLSAKILSILIDERPKTIADLKKSSRYQYLKVDTLLEFTSLHWNDRSFRLLINSASGFEPSFEINLDSDKGITSDGLVKFT